MLENRTIKLTVILLVLMIAGALLGVYLQPFYQQPVSQNEMEGVFWPEPKRIGPFTMQDQDNNEFTITQLQGKWSLLFFGYTNCPDVCPITMSVLQQVHDQLQPPNNEEAFQMIFVSVDPQRDTTDKIQSYINFFNPEFIGLGGTLDQLEGLSNQIGIAYIHNLPDEDGNYLVEHTSSIFLLDPNARLVSILSPPHNSETISNRFIEITRFLKSQSP